MEAMEGQSCEAEMAMIIKAGDLGWPTAGQLHDGVLDEGWSHDHVPVAVDEHALAGTLVQHQKLWGARDSILVVDDVPRVWHHLCHSL